jgi:hypothetical protein
MTKPTDGPPLDGLPATLPLRLLLEAMLEAGEPLEINFPSGTLRLTVEEMRDILAPDSQDNLL